MDLSTSLEPKSDQQNYDDYIAGPKTVTVSEVRKGNAEQPVEVHLVEFPGRPFKPSKSMRRVLAACWGVESDAYAGRQMTLFGDATVKFGKDTVGGIRISHLSHLDGPRQISLTVTRGKRAPFVVQPLVDELATHRESLNAASNLTELQIAWAVATKAGVSRDVSLVALKDARKTELSKPAEPITAEVVELDPAHPDYVEGTSA